MIRNKKIYFFFLIIAILTLNVCYASINGITSEISGTLSATVQKKYLYQM